MNDADRAIVAAAEERDRTLTDLDNVGAAARWLALVDRRELLRIVREQEAGEARIREGIAAELDLIAVELAQGNSEFATGSAAAYHFVLSLLGVPADPDTQAEDPYNDDAAEREFLRPIGGGL